MTNRIIEQIGFNIEELKHDKQELLSKHELIRTYDRICNQLDVAVDLQKTVKKYEMDYFMYLRKKDELLTREESFVLFLEFIKQYDSKDHTFSYEYNVLEIDKNTFHCDRKNIRYGEPIQSNDKYVFVYDVVILIDNSIYSVLHNESDISITNAFKQFLTEIESITTTVDTTDLKTLYQMYGNDIELAVKAYERLYNEYPSFPIVLIACKQNYDKLENDFINNLYKDDIYTISNYRAYDPSDDDS